MHFSMGLSCPTCGQIGRLVSARPAGRGVRLGWTCSLERFGATRRRARCPRCGADCGEGWTELGVSMVNASTGSSTGHGGAVMLPLSHLVQRGSIGVERLVKLAILQVSIAQQAVQ